MAVQLPAMKKLGEELGVSLDGGLAGVTSGLMDNAAAQKTPDPQKDD